MFIIEGSDNLGKTTAAHRLVELAAKRKEFPIYYCHMSRPMEPFDFFYDYADRISIHAVQDRFHLGGLIWHNDVITQDSLRYIESWLYRVGSFIVLFVSEDEKWYTARLNKSKRSEMFDPMKLIKANRNFRAMSERKFQPLVQFDHVIRVNGDDCFPNDSVLETLLDAWFARMRRGMSDA